MLETGRGREKRLEKEKSAEALLLLSQLHRSRLRGRCVARETSLTSDVHGALVGTFVAAAAPLFHSVDLSRERAAGLEVGFGAALRAFVKHALHELNDGFEEVHWRSRHDSNAHHQVRSPVLYPLSYESSCYRWRLLPDARTGQSRAGFEPAQ